jgi:FAD/FMN-containing dehydrogenase
MATGKHHLYVAGIGLISTTGIGGLVTGGGVGWLSRRYGLAIDSLLSVDIVTASGELLLNVCETNEAYRDLFFAVRGGGSNFGIVVSFTFRLVRVPFVVTRTQIVRSDDVQSAMARYGELLQSAPDSITSLGFLAGRSNKVAAFIVITTFVPDEDKQLADVEDALKCIEKFDLDGVSATRMTDVYEHLYELQVTTQRVCVRLL